MAKHDKVQRLEMARRGAQLRLAKMPWEQIAQEIGYRNASGAYKAVTNLMKAELAGPVEELVTEETTRIHAAMKAIWPDVLRGKAPAIDRMIALQNQLIRLTPGMIQNPEVSITGEGGASVTVVTSWPSSDPATLVIREEDLQKPADTANATALPKQL